MGHYELAEAADVYTQLMFTDYESVAQIAPGGNFFDTNTDQLRQPAAVGAQQVAPSLGCTAADDCGRRQTSTLYIARRNVEGGGRQQRFENTSFRALVGVRGQISEDWDYDTSAQYSALIADQSANNYFHKTRLTRSLEARTTIASTPAVTVNAATFCTLSVVVPRRHRSELRAVQPILDRRRNA